MLTSWNKCLNMFWMTGSDTHWSLRKSSQDNMALQGTGQRYQSWETWWLHSHADVMQADSSDEQSHRLITLSCNRLRMWTGKQSTVLFSPRVILKLPLVDSQSVNHSSKGLDVPMFSHPFCKYPILTFTQNTLLNWSVCFTRVLLVCWPTEQFRALLCVPKWLRFKTL